MAVLSGKLLAVALAVLAVGMVNVSAQLTCVVCDSQNDLNCIFNPTRLTPVTCPAAPGNALNSICLTRSTNGRVIRQCGEGQTCTAGDATCVLCTNLATATAPGGACNAVLPANRRSCVQCHGNLNSTCASAQFDTAFVACTQLETECFTRRSDRLVTRGCGSEHRGLCDDRGQCNFCPTNGCNDWVQQDTRIPRASSASFVTAAPALLLGAVAALLKANN